MRQECESRLTAAEAVRRALALGGLALLFVLLSGSATACTIPVFRYALDRWSGQTDENAEHFPVYEEIAKRILSGDSAVWVLIESGEKKKDDALFAKLRDRLKFFESVAELPEIDPNDPSSQLGPGPPLVLRFSVIRLARDHPAVAGLAGPKKKELTGDEAWITPVFGRGRVLGAWPASLMDEEGIDEVCFYLTGACSCQVKAQNPGWDIPTKIDWNARLYAIAEGEITDETDTEESPPAQPEPEEDSQNGDDEPTVQVFEPNRAEERTNRKQFVWGGLAIAIAGALWWFLRKR